MVEAVGAKQGFVLTRRGASFDLHFGARSEASRPGEQQGFHPALVERALAERQLVETVEPRAGPLPPGPGPRGAPPPAGRWLLVAPLEDRGDLYGAMYIQRDEGPLSLDARSALIDLVALAAPFLREALDRQRRPHGRAQELLAGHDFGELVTAHPAMLQLLATVARIAPSRASVLIQGETGTGKELIARALHANSERKHGPFVPLHVSALQESVMEAELFGHVKGAFTGADRARPGRIAGAHKGTLFLDEIAEIPLHIQAKLLRFVQFGEIQPVGSDRVEKVDVRVVAATHQDLGAMIQQSRFRQDLYFRLKVVELSIPPLRERASDIPLLVDALMRQHWQRPGPPPKLTRRAQDALRSHAYRGNVRELSNLIERAILLASGPEIDLDVFPPEIQAAHEQAASSERFVDYTAAELAAAREAARGQVEREFVEGLMRRHEGNVSMAARTAGMHRSYLQRLLARRRA